jgi:hypothetical protein
MTRMIPAMISTTAEKVNQPERFIWPALLTDVYVHPHGREGETKRTVVP